MHKVYRRYSKYKGLETSTLQWLQEMEAVNDPLKRIVAQQTDIDVFKEGSQNTGKLSSPTTRRRAVSDRTRAAATPRY